MEFNSNLAEKHLKKLLKQYKIEVIAWSVGSNGYAYPTKSQIKIPKPTNIDRFCVAMHEIKHVIDGVSGNLYDTSKKTQKSLASVMNLTKNNSNLVLKYIV